MGVSAIVMRRMEVLLYVSAVRMLVAEPINQESATDDHIHGGFSLVQIGSMLGGFSSSVPSFRAKFTQASGAFWSMR